MYTAYEVVVPFFASISCVLGWMFNMFAVYTFIHNQMLIPKEMRMAAMFPFGTWLFCVGILIGMLIRSCIYEPVEINWERYYEWERSRLLAVKLLG